MESQLTKGQRRRVMYVERKAGTMDGVHGRVGWVTFSKSGQSLYYRDLTLQKGSGTRGNFFDTGTGEEYWVSGVKARGSNAHPEESGVTVEVDADALEAYRAIRKISSACRP